jgi:hypothetical protein
VPNVLRLGGCRFFFFSNEGREPPHIHVEQGDSYAKFWLTPVALSWLVGYTSPQLRRLRELVEAHRDLLEARWHEHFGG